MGRMIIQLTSEQQEKLRKRAKEEKVSMAEFVREALDAKLAEPVDEEELRRRALSVIGCAHSGTGDVSERHNEYFAESVLDG